VLEAPHHYGSLHAIWDHTELPATPTLTPAVMLMLMLMNSFYLRANLVTYYDSCAMSVVFRCEQKGAGFSDCDFRDGGNEFQHISPETANAREP